MSQWLTSEGDQMGTGVFFYRVLGAPAVDGQEGEVPLGPPQARKVFALLLVEANRVVSRDRLAEELWGDTPPASAKVQLQGLISQLRRVLHRQDEGCAPIVTCENGYRLRVEPGQSDLDLFTTLTARGRAGLAGGRWAEASDLFRRALALWRGPVLGDVLLLGSPSLLARWEELRLSTVEDCAAVEVQLGEYARVIHDLRDLIERHPFRERACGLLMTALARAGRAADALEVYREWHQRLRDELGVEPSPSLSELHGDILRAAPGVRPPGFTARPDGFVPCQLPSPVPTFVGREALLDDLLAAASPDPDRDAPLVLVLTGVGGIGKTALAVQLAHRVSGAYPDGQLFVSLRGTTAEPRQPEAVLAAFLRSLGVPPDRIPADPEEGACLFRSVLHGRRVLLVLDDAADETQLRPLLPAAPGCAVIATSRFTLGGLELGRLIPLDVLPDAEAVALLARLSGDERVKAGTPALDRVLDVCGGLPLALRIVGSRLADKSRWTLDDVAEALSEEHSRLDWLRNGDLAVRSSLSLSYRQLDPLARRVFRGLGLAPLAEFPGWTAAVLAELPIDSAERALDDLHRRHLVLVTGRDGGRPRYRMHDLVRSLARETVAAEPGPDRGAAVTRVLGGWLWLAELVADRLPGSILRPEPGDAVRLPLEDVEVRAAATADPLDWFQAEQPALEAAVSSAAELGLGEQAWELAVVLAGYFDHRGLYADWSRCHGRALDAARAAGCVRGEAGLLRGIGQLHIYRDEFTAASRALGESLRLSEVLGDERGAARALTGLSVLARVTGRPAESWRLAGRALAVCVRVGDRMGEAHLHTSLAVLSLEAGRFDRAVAALDAAAWLCAELGDDHRTALLLRRYGQLHLARGDVDRAMECLRRALDLLAPLSDDQCAAQVCLDIGRVHTKLGEHRAAVRELRGASSLFTGAGNLGSAAACTRLLGALAH
ncbi:AfsR/SARP family transcriptional regulator [Amycolatopsis sp. H20-H5]|uniref:AfsR/SARP family transcriptional regulator n=1 Tax=Amycolatopsis sp. H20-H5 TaxID=3046309 RepID=UPI002DB8D0A0|nr:BTAD domain-containing putative transcriptional regulator [Amycolatopsis sp. H20-H5]MEC3976755.1 BTAD domain-containing putative transcriptional regulator [Amycolatopsis sp. H20-H5]